MYMSLVDNKTFELWRSFMPHRKSIRKALSSNLISLQTYDPVYFEQFDPRRPFTKWAAVEVDDFDHIPEGMETFTLPGGQYAVFHHRGPASAGGATFQYIFKTWLPYSEYVLDNRAHFEVLGEKYKNNEPDSEEEVWIPVRRVG
jgi:AraC family transcriptional regulator